jgi:CspA family cold shock protein
MSEREFGRVKFWDNDKGYGFIRADNGRDVFVHVSATGFLSPSVGDRVSFEVGTNPRSGKPEAKAVAITDGD